MFGEESLSSLVVSWELGLGMNMTRLEPDLVSCVSLGKSLHLSELPFSFIVYLEW